MYTTVSFKTDSSLPVTSHKFRSHKQRMLFPPFSTSIQSSIKRHIFLVNLRMENQITKHETLVCDCFFNDPVGFVLAGTTPIPAWEVLNRRTLSADGMLLRVAILLGTYSISFCSEAAEGSTSKIP